MSFFTLLGKEFMNLRKNMGVLIILFLVPIFIIVIMGFAFQEKETKYGLGIVNYDGNKNIITGLTSSLSGVSALDVKQYKEEAEASKELKKEKITGYIVIPKGFNEKHEVGEGELRFIVDNTRPVNASIIQGITNSFIEKFNSRVMSVMTALNVSMQQNPRTDAKEVITASKNYLDSMDKEPIEVKKEYITPETKGNKMASFNQTTCGMTAMFILFLCVLWGSGNILEEKLSGTMTRLVLSPVNIVTILSSKLVYIGLLSVLQFIIFFGVGHSILNVPVGNVWLLILLNIVFIAQAASLGLFVSIVAKSRIAAMGLSFFVIMLLSPLGGLWFPLETVPKGLQIVASFLPTGSFMIAIDKIIIKNGDFYSILNQLLVIMLYFVVTFTASIKIGILRKAYN